jgi:cell wall-associated NlpC family hydrolase
MPSRPRNLLLVLAIAATVFGCAGSVPRGLAAGPALAASAASSVAGPRLHRRPVRKPTIGERAAAIALREVGVPYQWGGISPTTGFDCSGLVYWTYGRLGIALPHSSYALYDLGRRVARSRMRPGDLLFFSGLGHVGIYIGRGRMVHAPHSGTVVQVVRLASSSYESRIVGIRRIRKH